jgi:hypothetical protein
MLLDDDAHNLIVINDFVSQIGKADQTLSHADVYLSVGSGLADPISCSGLSCKRVR